jgi:hypothetical protein
MLPGAVQACSRLLSERGVVAISMKDGMGEGIEERRQFTYWRMAELKNVIEGAGFDIVHSETSGSLDGRDVSWHYVVARLNR